ncbi:glutathione S-transferase family protein [Sporobolomyces koalae]|uniref:glutathione S-transferase family protein n=1 Tax=Sporobolomyces koalae TaxID=500713 RepID=UPI003176369F
MSQDQKLVIYTSPAVFVNPQRIRLLAHEKGIADQLDEKVLDMTPVGEQRGWRHLKVNPYGETPALVLPDGTNLSEAVAIARYLDNTFRGRKILGESVQEQAQVDLCPASDESRTQRIWVHLMYRLTVAFHVLHQGLGHKLELVKNEEWGRHCRREAIATAGMLDKHLSDGRKWILGGNEPTFADITLCVAIAFSKFRVMDTDLTERFEYLEYFWKRWQERDSFKKAYADGAQLPELKHLTNKL